MLLRKDMGPTSQLTDRLPQPTRRITTTTITMTGIALPMSSKRFSGKDFMTALKARERTSSIIACRM